MDVLYTDFAEDTEDYKIDGEKHGSTEEIMTKTVLITGAGGGIGRATIHHFAANGWRVVGVDRAGFGEGFPQDGHFIQADISQPELTEQIFEEARGFHPSLDVLVNNAAVQVAKPLVETTVEEWDAVMASNLRSVFLFVKLAHPLMKAAGGGAIVNVSSVHAIQTSANIAAYAASKGGLLALTRAMAIEFAPDNIRVNAILPGAVDTPMLRAGLGAVTWVMATCRIVWITLRGRQSAAKSASPKRSPARFTSWRIMSNRLL